MVDERYKESYRIFEQAQTLLPGGVTRARVPHVPGRYPVYMEKALGAHVWDVDGNEYIDWMSGYGCILLGHRWKEVDDAALRAIENGFISQLPAPIQNELAETLLKLIPCAERVRFFKIGTDATTAAVRIARIYTGRDHVIRWGYHGWADWSVSNFHGFDAGVPQAVRDLTHTFEYNNLTSLESVFRDHPDQIACVIMMPMEIEPPAPGFLQGVKDLCHKNGTVFILDEVRSGFRMALGGAQEYYGVEPDLAAFSKAMANGYAIAAVVGKEEIMSCLVKGLFSATFFVSALEMAASLATISIIQREEVIARIWETGGKFQKSLSQVLAGSSLNLQVVGAPPMPFVQFAIPEADVNVKAKMAFYAEAARQGVYFHPNHHWFVNFSHTEEDIERTMQACASALKVAEEAAS